MRRCGVRFGPWYPLADAGSHAPAGDGVLQVRRAVGLVDYPRGKSAMLQYAYTHEVQATALAIAAAHREENLWGRHLIEVEPATDLGAFCESLRADFVRRFGAPPMFERTS